MRNMFLAPALSALMVATGFASEPPVMGADILQPKIVKGTLQTIAYPRRHLRAGRQGYVLVDYGVSMDGKAHAPKIWHTDPPGAFDSVVLAEIDNWRFELPGDWAGRWESARFPYLFVFRIGNCDAPLTLAPANLPVKLSVLISCVP